MKFINSLESLWICFREKTASVWRKKKVCIFRNQALSQASGDRTKVYGGVSHRSWNYYLAKLRKVQSKIQTSHPTGILPLSKTHLATSILDPSLLVLSSLGTLIHSLSWTSGCRKIKPRELHHIPIPYFLQMWECV